MPFPTDFVWGAATSSYQIEGAAHEDGKGPSIWDMFCRREGAILEGQNGDVACDHYHRYAEDIALMREIDLQGYRFSIAWPRILPEGAGTVNDAGLAFYDRLVDALLEAGITPFATLYHWDLPLALYQRGGWLNREIADWFADYAQVVVGRLGDRVTHWMTLNELKVFVGEGYMDGSHAPGHKLPLREVLLAGHHALLAHGKAVQAIRATSPQPCQVGWAPTIFPLMPAEETPETVAMVRQITHAVNPQYPFWSSSWLFDPVFLGTYPEDGLALFGKDAPDIQPGDMETIQQPLDFSGLNIYQGFYLKTGAEGPAPVKPKDGAPLTALHWNVTPETLYWGPKFFYERYQTPIYITENGMSNVDWVALDGKVHDPQRIDFTTRYLQQLQRASEDGVDVRGYFHWSLMDNFEWAHGYRERLGLIYVDFETQARVLKDSAYWYRDVIAGNGIQ
ncbi:MAG: beta-glucosidase [Anaerolineae bacterium]|nr:beta-glucosidase [Anaerolineae bacterium]